MEWGKQRSKNIIFNEDTFNEFLSDVFGLRYNFKLFHETKTPEAYHNHEFDIIEEKKFLLAKLKYGF